MTVYHVLRDEAMKVGIKKVGERTRFVGKLSEKKGEGRRT